MPSIIQTPLNTFTTPAAPVCTITANTVFSTLCPTISSFSLPSKLSPSTPKSRPISLPFSIPSLRLSTVASSTTTTTCPHLSEPKKLKPQFPIDSPLDSESTVSQVSIDELFNSLCLAKKGSDFELVRATHALFLKLHDDTSLGNAVISAYLKMGLIVDAYQVFMCLSNPNVVSFTSLISSFAKANRESDAIELFFKMRCLGIEPNEYSFVAILTVCIRTLDVELGMQLHCLVVKLGYLDSVFVVNALMAMYANCGCFDNVVKLLEKMNQRDVASWNTVLSSLIKEGLNEQALDLFRDLSKENGIVADQITLSTLLTACIGCNALAEGKEVHSYAFRVGLEKSLNMGNAFVKFYTKCGSLKNVVDVFEMMPVRDVVTWTELIVAYMEFGFVDLAIEAFKKMPERNSVSCNAMMAGFCRNGEALKVLSMFFRMIREGMPLDEFALTSVVTACGLLMEPEICKQIHAFVIKFGIGFNACVEAALLDMYTRCRMMIAADLMFHSWPSGVDNSVIQTSMLCAYARNGQTEHAISLFHHSQLEGNIVVDEVVVSSVLGVCGTLGFHEMGSQIHTLAIKKGFEYDLGVGNSLISMYSKCCNIDDAVKVFNKMLVKDTVSWNCLISGHILHRQGDEALAIWLRMKREGVKPDATTFVLVISAYRHTSLNLIDECRNLFLSLKTAYSIDPTSEHYATYVGVLGYWGFLEEAEEVISHMPFEAEVSIWKALLDSCRLHFNTSIGKRVAKHILAMEPQDPSSYVLVSNLYSASGRWHCSEMMRDKMRERGLHKHPCRSWIIHDKKVHSFYTRDRSHPQTKDIYSALDILVLECLKAGYVPDTSYVLHEVEEHQKKDFLFYHSAKLAATYGLLMSRHRKPIRVVKNVVLCGDCHTFLKYVSEVSGREIVFRDASGFHCFANGQCSCKDYW